jgi:hypothetical protein
MDIAGLVDDRNVDSVAAASLASDSAVLVPVPEAERVVNRLRAGLGRAAALGVPAHVTVLYPFVAPSAITAARLKSLRTRWGQ